MQWCEEVAGHAAHGACLFEDALHVIPNGVYDSNATYSSKSAAVKKTTPATRAHCLTHGKPCSLKKACCLDVSGLPCPDMSSCGLQMKRAGVTSNVYLAHGLHTTHSCTPLLLIECTKDSSLKVKFCFFGCNINQYKPYPNLIT